MPDTKTNNGYRYQIHQGQGLLEYSLIGMLVLVVCVAGLEIFTGEMSQLWQKLWADMESRQGQAVAVTAPPSPPAPYPKSPGDSEGRPVVIENPGATKFVTKKGTVITLPDTVDKMEETIRTLGANGTTTILANSLDVLIKQLVANSEIDSAQAQNLMTLANQGHTLAKLQKLAENIVSTTTTSSEFVALMENNPTIMSKDEDSYRFNMGYYYPDDADPLDQNVSFLADGVVGDFLRTYHAVLASGALDDPAVRAVVDTLTRKISNLNTVTLRALCSLSNDEIGQSEVSEIIAKNIDKTHDKSAQICTTGNGQDSGTQCTGGG